MIRSEKMSVRFWGVRGSIPTASPDKMVYGGNTSCIEIRVPSGETFVIDGGTGALPLGNMLMKEAGGRPLSVHFFLTHFHWDHIQGIPFFQPLFSSNCTVTFYSMYPESVAHEFLRDQMSSPYFPTNFDDLPARRGFVNVRELKTPIEEVQITSFQLNHPQGCCGYRFECGTSVVVVATDHEHSVPYYDGLLIGAARGADLLVYDAQYTPEEYPLHRGWGHSTWLEGTKVAKEAGVKRLVLFHHNPTHSDPTMGQILLDARQEFPETFLAAEGMTIKC